MYLFQTDILQSNCITYVLREVITQHALVDQAKNQKSKNQAQTWSIVVI